MGIFNSGVGNIVNTIQTAQSAVNLISGTFGLDYSSYRFPSDLDVIDHWMDITIFEYSRANRDANATKKNIKGHITLPLPAKLATGYSADYENEKMGLVEHAAAAATKIIAPRFSGKGTDIGSIADQLSSEASNQLKTATGLMAGYALDEVPGTLGVQLQLGMARNPHYAVLYKGPKFRTHQFQWTFMPRDVNESRTLQNIIKLLKYSQAPDISASFQNHLFKYPEECEVKFHHPTFLFSIGPSVITDITIEYHGDQPAYFQYTHAPVQVTLGISLQETTVLTKQDIKNYNR